MIKLIRWWNGRFSFRAASKLKIAVPAKKDFAPAISKTESRLHFSESRNSPPESIHFLFYSDFLIIFIS